MLCGMSEDVELEALLKAHQSELKAIADAAASGNRDKAIDAVSSLAVSLATGNPLLGVLAPLGRKGVARAFGNSVNAVLTRELAALAKDEERRAFLAQIGDVVEALLGQALIQLIRSQHAVKEELRASQDEIASEWLEALGGMRNDLKEFRADFAEQLARASDSIGVDSLVVRDGGLGVRVSAGTSQRMSFRHVEVSGVGSVGFELR